MSLRSLGRSGASCARLVEASSAPVERWAASANAARRVEKTRSTASKRIARPFSSSSRTEQPPAASSSARSKSSSKGSAERSTAVSPAALSALLARLSLLSSASLHALLLTALTHPSYKPATPESSSTSTSGSASHADADLPFDPSNPLPLPIESNELLSALGNSLLGLFASEHLATIYPNLPTRALKAAISAHVGPTACFNVARELGVGVVDGAGPQSGVPLRWTRGSGVAIPDLPGAGQRRRKMAALVRDGQEVPQSWKDGFKWEDVVASAVRSFVAIIFQEKGMHAASDFVHANFLTRHVDVSALLNFRNPKHVLAFEVRKLMAEAGAGNEAAIETRLLAESGRHSLSPIYSVGLFLPSGLKLAEGHGSSMRMAEHRAAVNALNSIYTVRGDNLELALEDIGRDGQVPKSRTWTLPTSLHTDYPLGASLSGSTHADAGVADDARVAAGTGIHEREDAFEGRIGLGRSEVLAESGRKWRMWRDKGADERVAA